MTTLKPCPFCGGKPSLANDDRFAFIHSCAGIRIVTEWFSSLDEAAKAWNRRGDGWKSASEKPKTPNVVEVTNGMARDYGSFKRYWITNFIPRESITHWRELPELPTKGG